MSDKTLRVICNLPSQHGIVFRATPPTLAHDSAHYMVPQDLELKAGENLNVSADAVRYWAARSDLSWKQVGDTVTLTYDGGRHAALREQIERDLRAADEGRGAEVREQIARDRAALDAERHAFEREKIEHERAAIAAERGASDAGRKTPRSRPRKRR